MDNQSMRSASSKYLLDIVASLSSLLAFTVWDSQWNKIIPWCGGRKHSCEPSVIRFKRIGVKTWSMSSYKMSWTGLWGRKMCVVHTLGAAKAIRVNWDAILENFTKERTLLCPVNKWSPWDADVDVFLKSFFLANQNFCMAVLSFDWAFLLAQNTNNLIVPLQLLVKRLAWTNL